LANSDLFTGEILGGRSVITGPLIVYVELLGVVSIGSDGNSINNVMIDKTGLGDTGEIYLVNSEGYAITPLLSVEDAVLKWKIDTINSRNCFSHEHEKEIEWEGHEETLEFLNYKGGNVIGTHIYIPEMKWCLLAEINEEEILGKQRIIFQKTALTIIISIVVIITLIGFFIGKFIDKRVVLKKGMKRL